MVHIKYMFKLAPWVLILIFLAGCGPGEPEATITVTLEPSATSQPTLNPTVTRTFTPTAVPPTDTPTHTPTVSPSPTPDTGVPPFSHIVIIVLENREFGSVIGNRAMPIFNQWANDYTLLSQHYAIRHPSLPNYLAMVGGSTFGIDSNCSDCFVDAPSLPDLIEANGRTWKGYMEDMPEPCYIGDTATYVQKHNPFIYFDPIRLDTERCERSIVPFTELDKDLSSSTLPNFVFITPNQCNNAHDCDEKTADLWLGTHVPYLLSYPAIAENGLVVLTWDEGQGDHGCCGIEPGGGRIATVLISPLARRGFVDDTPYTLYSLLKTVAASWRLPYLGEAAKDENVIIQAPWVTNPP